MQLSSEPPIDRRPSGPTPTASLPATGPSAVTFAFDERPPRRRRRRGAVAIAVIVGAALVGGAVLGVQASSADPLAQLRTATVQTRSVAQTIDTVASVAPVSQASVAFPVSGTVATVAVAAGDVVTAGQVLATLDTTSLDATVNERQADLANAQLSLQQALNGETVTGSGAASGAPTGGAGTTGSGSSPSAPSASADSSTTGATTPTAVTGSQLVAYQKAVDAAALDLLVAEQAIQQATIVSPIDGTVVSLGLGAGDDVTAASSTAAVVVAGAGGFELTTTVSVADLPDVEVGQSVVVRPDASAQELEGSVVAIGVTPSASSTTDYPITIGITGDSSGLRNGSTASISIITSDEVDAVAVPSSAVTTDGDRRTVSVVDAAGQTTDVTVEVGAVGGAWIAITDGLDLGQTVVLANLDEALPGSATDATATTTGRVGAGATGGPPAGFTGGPPAGFTGGGARPGG